MQEFAPLLDGIYLTGATASGKSEIGLLLAEQLEAEIISLDSMAVYQQMDIGTAKPTQADRQRVPHHLLDLVPASQSFSLADYLSAAHAAAAEIQARNRLALFVGGTPLYLKALLRGVCEGPPADPEFRQQVEAEVERHGLPALRERLKQVDPLSAAKLHPHDKRRMIRALEVYTLTGTPISHYQTQFEEQSSQRCPRVFALAWDRSDLHDRINMRVDNMFEQGFVDEVRQIEKQGGFGETSIQGVGYREVLDFLHGRSELAEAVEHTKSRTRKFARRQETWFRGLQECRWVTRNDSISAAGLVDQLMVCARSTSST